MPLTDKGSKILSSMQDSYGPAKGKSVFYASVNKGTIKGAEGDRYADGGRLPPSLPMIPMDVPIHPVSPYEHYNVGVQQSGPKGKIPVLPLPRGKPGERLGGITDQGDPHTMVDVMQPAAQGGLVDAPGHYAEGGSQRDWDRREPPVLRGVPGKPIPTQPILPVNPQQPWGRPGQRIGEIQEEEAPVRRLADGGMPMPLNAPQQNQPWQGSQQGMQGLQQGPLPSATSSPATHWPEGGRGPTSGYMNWDRPSPMGYQGPPSFQQQGFAVGGLTESNLGTMERFGAHQAAETRRGINLPGAKLISGQTPGRTDRIAMDAKPGSFVMPADVVSGLGQGNTQAGAKMWGDAISHAIGGVGALKARTPMALPRQTAPRMSFGAVSRPSKSGLGFADGGLTDPGEQQPTIDIDLDEEMGLPEGGGADDNLDNEDYVPIVTAGGEMIIDPAIVAAIGGGSLEEGNKILNASVISVRKQVIEHMQDLPGPVE